MILMLQQSELMIMIGGRTTVGINIGVTFSERYA